MSEHGSWANKAIWCQKCADAFFIGMEAFDPHPVGVGRYAGKVSGGYDGEEAEFICNTLDDIRPNLCEGHTVTVAVLCEGPVVLLRASREAVEECRPATVWKQVWPHVPTKEEIERAAYNKRMHERIPGMNKEPLTEDERAIFKDIFKRD